MRTALSVAREKGVHRQSIYRAIHKGELAAVKWGRDWMVSDASASAWEAKKNGRPRRKRRRRAVASG